MIFQENQVLRGQQGKQVSSSYYGDFEPWCLHQHLIQVVTS